MRIFISNLTIYSYDEKIRIRLNQEEVKKFLEGLNFAGDFDKGVVFSDHSVNEIEKIAESLTKEEEKTYKALLSKIREFKYIHVNLTDYNSAFNTMYKVIYDLVDAHIQDETVSLKINLSCGHKIGSLALYLSLMKLIYSRKFYRYLNYRSGDYLVVDIYHAEKNIIEKLPLINFESERNGEWERYLVLLKNPKSIEEFRNILKENIDKTIMSFKKHGYIKMRNNLLYLTEKGKTLVSLLEKLT